MQNGEQYMKQKRKFTKSLLRPIFNALIGLIMLLSFAIGIVGYFEFADALKQQYMQIANGIAENVALGIEPGEFFYFTHSYIAPDTPATIATTQHSIEFPCAVQYRDKAFGVQFHPEKSSDAGARLLRNFVRIAGEIR